MRPYEQSLKKLPVDQKHQTRRCCCLLRQADFGRSGNAADVCLDGRFKVKINTNKMFTVEDSDDLRQIKRSKAI